MTFRGQIDLMLFGALDHLVTFGAADGLVDIWCFGETLGHKGMDIPL